MDFLRTLSTSRGCSTCLSGLFHLCLTFSQENLAKNTMYTERKSVNPLIAHKNLRTVLVYMGPYTLSVNQSCPKSVENCSIFKIFQCLYDAVSKLCRLEFNFQYLLFSNCAGKKCAVIVYTGGLSVTFSPFSKCAGTV